MPNKDLDKIHEDLQEMKIAMTRLNTYIESEMGTPNSEGNIPRQLNQMNASLEEIRKTLQSEDGHGARIRALEVKSGLVDDNLTIINKWVSEMSEIASPSELKELKKEVGNQKKKWIIASTIFAVVQALVMAAIKFFK